MLTKDVQDMDISWQLLGELKSPDRSYAVQYYSGLIEGKFVDKVVSLEPEGEIVYYINTHNMVKYPRFKCLVDSILNESADKA